MKKLNSKIEDTVVDRLTGETSAHASLNVNIDAQYIVRLGSLINNKVDIISGGGGGHESMHGGFVYKGMLDGACLREVFN